jgi:hypothetical protein
MSNRVLLVMALVTVLAALLPLTVAAQEAVHPPHKGIRSDAPRYGVHGPYWVGTTTIAAQTDLHPTHVVLWYPALNPDGLEETTAYPFDYWPPRELTISGHALQDASPDTTQGPYPLVIFAHGWTASRKAKKPHGRPDSRLRSVAVVVMKDATQHVATPHRTARCSTCRRDGNLLINLLIRARRVEKRDVLAHDTAQMRLIDDQHLVQAFFPDRADPPFRVCVRIRGMTRNGDHMDTYRPEHRVVGMAELLVVVADQKVDGWFAPADLPHHLACLLGDPGVVRMGGAARKVDLSAADFDEHQHIDSLQKQGVDGEIIAGQQLILVVRHQVPPTR